MNENVAFELYKQFHTMNRDQKRALAKKLKVSYKQLVDAMSIKIEDMSLDEVPKGSKVKLKYDQIIKKKDQLSEKYLTWLEENKNKTFTFEPYGDNPSGTRGTFEEDETNPKWIFSVTDLIFDFDEIKNNIVL